MRITNNMLVNNMVNYIGTNLGRMDRYQNQMATGKKIRVPSDDPIVAARALKLRTDVSEIDQYIRNVQDAVSWLSITESTMSNMTDILQRTRELAVYGANGSSTGDDTSKMAEEVDQLRLQTIHLGNATYAGRYIFSGFKTDTAFIDEESGNFNIPVDTTENIKYEIGIGDEINVNVTGGDIFNGGATANIPDVDGDNKGRLIKVFDDFLIALKTGDKKVIGESIGSLDVEIKNLLRVRADAGARMNRLELTENRLQSDLVNFTQLMSENEDIDMAETIMRLKNEENVYKASLSGGARVIMPTLLDFLR